VVEIKLIYSPITARAFSTQHYADFHIYTIIIGCNNSNFNLLLQGVKMLYDTLELQVSSLMHQRVMPDQFPTDMSIELDVSSMMNVKVKGEIDSVGYKIVYVLYQRLGTDLSYTK
jgi:hypothetical protein